MRERYPRLRERPLREAGAIERIGPRRRPHVGRPDLGHTGTDGGVDDRAVGGRHVDGHLARSPARVGGSAGSRCCCCRLLLSTTDALLLLADQLGDLTLHASVEGGLLVALRLGLGADLGDLVADDPRLSPGDLEAGGILLGAVPGGIERVDEILTVSRQRGDVRARDGTGGGVLGEQGVDCRVVGTPDVRLHRESAQFRLPLVHLGAGLGGQAFGLGHGLFGLPEAEVGLLEAGVGVLEGPLELLQTGRDDGGLGSLLGERVRARRADHDGDPDQHGRGHDEKSHTVETAVESGTEAHEGSSLMPQKGHCNSFVIESS